MKKYINGKYIEMTEEEIAEIEDSRQQYLAYEKHRPLTQEEVNQIIIKAQVNTVDIDDQTSLRMLDYYPTWESLIGTTVDKVGFKFTYQGKLYKTIQAHTFQESWVPCVGTESLYARIDEEHLGNKYDPIPYDGNMALTSGLYYMQDWVIYKCTRDTGNPVYHALSDLVGLYVEKS